MKSRHLLLAPLLAFLAATAHAAPPSTTTSAATAVTSASATLNGSANPNALSSQGHFRYASNNPGTCNDTFGTRAPAAAASDTVLGSGTNPVDFSQAVTGLAPLTTYYFCAIANNSNGVSFGALLSFATPAGAPTVTTGAATNLTGSSATLNATGNPNGDAANGWFRYSTSNPGSCNDTFGTRTPSVGGATLGMGTTPQAYSNNVSGLSPSTTYYYCAIASNSVGTGLGTVGSFTTPAAPTVSTSAATGVTDTSATVSGSANPNGAATTGYVRVGTVNPGTCNDSFGTRDAGTALGSGNSIQPFSRSLTGLAPGTTYYFCALASNSVGLGSGAVLSFTTLGPPAVTTVPATSVTSTSATLNAQGNPRGTASTGYLRYSATNPGSCNDSFGTRAPSSASGDAALGSGNAPVAYSQPVSALLPGTTYYYCAIAVNAFGAGFGSVLSFTTAPGAPTVTTTSATNRTGTGATLNASVNPGGDSALGWFRYSTTNPGTCNDAFGTRTADVALGAGTSAQPLSQPIAGLVAGTTYYYCALASNSIGLSVGAVEAFFTPLPPAVSTSAATNLLDTQATLNGSANPNGAETGGWFRYWNADPVTCNDSFGVRVPASAVPLGSGTSPQAFQQTLFTLAPATTYYYCAIASNSEGLAFGPVVSFTTPQHYTLAVNRTGFGSGTVTGTVPGPSTVIDCGAVCSATLPAGITVTLNAAPAAGSSFAGWGGACAGAGTGACIVTMDAAKQVTARFDPPPSGDSADLQLSQSASPNPASAGKDVILTLAATNAGPAAVTSVGVATELSGDLAVIWASPSCAIYGTSVWCIAGALAASASQTFRVVVRPRSAGSFGADTVATHPGTDPAPGNNSGSLNVPVNATPAGTPIQRYRLYGEVTKEHLFTTDFNEYTVLGSSGGWVQEGTVGKVLNNPGSFGGVAAVPYYRLYDTNTQWHHWTTDANEYYTLGFVYGGWNMEGVDGWILPTQAPGTIELYRLNYPALGALHHWTIDANEYNTLIAQYGWVGEPGAGFVVP